MILADKIIRLRKKNGWSQEELANEIGVSRQSVSKWEGAQSVPDLDKILKLGKIFGVSTDYLLKDDIEEIPEEKKEQPAPEVQQPTDEETVTMTIGDVTEFFKRTDLTSIIKATAFALMICSSAVLMLFINLGVLTQNSSFNSIGVALMTMMIEVGVILLFAEYKLSKKYSYTDMEKLEFEYGGTSVAEDKKEKFGKKYSIMKRVGIALCIVFAVSLIILLTLNIAGAETVLWCSVFALMMLSLGGGTFLLTFANNRLDNIDRILEEGKFTRGNKKRAAGIRVFGTIYACIFLLATVVTMFINATVCFIVMTSGVLLYLVIYAALDSQLIKKKK